MNTQDILRAVGLGEGTVIASPFARALEQNLDLNTLLSEDPDAGEERLEALEADALDEISTAGGTIIYRLRGAEPAFSTPMQYGGHYLERDRELLTEAKASGRTILWIDGGTETYFDCLSDLPADAVVCEHAAPAIKNLFDCDVIDLGGVAIA